MNGSASETTRNVGKTILTLPSDTEIVMTRFFDAPRARVFAAHASCEHLCAWWGPHGHTMPECHMDFLEEARDATIASGMAHGAAETWDRLEEHLGTMV